MKIRYPINRKERGYHHRVTSTFMDESETQPEDIDSWLEDNIGYPKYHRTFLRGPESWSVDVYLQNEDDALLFKLAWGGEHEEL